MYQVGNYPKEKLRFKVSTRLAATSTIVCFLMSIPAPQAYTASVHLASTKFVSSRGFDTGKCTLQFPCATLKFATALARPGDTVIMQPGIYGPQYISAMGTVESPIHVVAPGSVTLTRSQPASDASQNTQLLRIVNSAYVTVAGFTVIGMKGRSDYVAKDAPYGGEVLIEDHRASVGQGITIEDFVVESANNTCIKTQDHESGTVITDNILIDCGEPGQTRDHGIYISGPNALIDSNVIAGSTGYGIHVYGSSTQGALITSNSVSGAIYAGIFDQTPPDTISKNVIYNNGWGIQSGPGAIIANNILANNNVGNAGQHGYGIDFDSIGYDNIYNNTFFHNKAELYNCCGKPTGPIVVENNIFDDGPTASYAKLANVVPPGSVIDYNLYHGVGIPPSGGGEHSIQADPLFIDPGLNFHLQSSSPAINAGIQPGGEVQGVVPDLGALCFSCQSRGNISGPGRGTIGVQ